jgi:hypothetical protein
VVDNVGELADALVEEGDVSSEFFHQLVVVVLGVRVLILVLALTVWVVLPLGLGGRSVSGLAESLEVCAVCD